VQQLDGRRAYGPGRKGYLDQVPDGPKRDMVSAHYKLLDVIVEQRDQALKRVIELGKPYREIERFQKIPGIGPVSAHVFSAFIMTPHRFRTVRKLWRYCRLGISDRSSDGKPLGYQRLDRHGNNELKTVSYHAWRSAVSARTSNEVKDYFEAGLDRHLTRRHARLTTQRKILEVMWTLWRKDLNYDIEQFRGQTSRPEVSA